MVLGVDSAPNKNECREYFLGAKGGRCVGMTILPSSFADCLEIWELGNLGTRETSWNSQGFSRPVGEFIYLQPLHTRLGGPQGRSGRIEEEKNLLPVREFEPRSFVALTTALSRLRTVLTRAEDIQDCIYEF